jgi:sec-independent protein translocase protein TatA
MLGDILQPTHLIFILIAALLFLGPKRLPSAGRALGQGLKEFKSSITGEPGNNSQPEATLPVPGAITEHHDHTTAPAKAQE